MESRPSSNKTTRPSRFEKVRPNQETTNASRIPRRHQTIYPQHHTRIMLDEQLVSFLKQNAGITALAEAISVGQVPVKYDSEGNTTPTLETWIWISTYDKADQIDLDGETGTTVYRFDIEACSVDDPTAKKLGRLVEKALQGYGPGSFGEIVLADDSVVAGTVDAIWVENKDEDYVPSNRFTHEDVSVVAFDIQIVADDSQDDQQSGD